MWRTGYVSRGVDFQRRGDVITIGFSTWQIDLPSVILEDERTLTGFLQGSLPVDKVVSSADWVDRLLAMLVAQGAVQPDCDGERSAIVPHLFEGFANYWYGQYFASPLWPLLKQSGDRAERLVNHWVVRTYFLSRSAGMTAATASIAARRADIRHAFRKSALEEFDHCERYYKPGGRWMINEVTPELLRITPASWAFDLQMTQIAMSDDLAHIFVALFQERTAQFKRNANDLYTAVEQRYGVPGYFEGWRKHIGYDEDNAHAADLETLLMSGWDGASAEELLGSVVAASASVEFLTESLVEILVLSESGLHPLADTPASSTFDLHVNGDTLRAPRARDALLPWVRQSLAGSIDLSASTEDIVLHASARALFSALSRAQSHNEILVFGRACERLSDTVLAEPRPDSLLWTALNLLFADAHADGSEILWRCRLMLTLCAGEEHVRQVEIIDAALAALEGGAAEESPSRDGDVLQYLIAALSSRDRPIRTHLQPKAF
jgi:hypothetical protein